MALRLGSLCTGYGGLDLAAEAVLGPLEHAWHAEIDPHASRVLAHHWPGTPNLGDLTAVDWTRVAPIDVLTAGYPCQGESLAGRRRGANDERWIWPDVLAAVRVLRPRLVLLENVSGHLSLGFGRVLGDLAAAGFDAEWGCFRASDVGAPHRRDRVFIVAWPAANAPRLGHGHAGPARIGGVPAAAVSGGAEADGMTLLPTPDATHGRKTTRTGPLLAGAVELLPTPRTSDMRGPVLHGSGGPDLRTAVSLLPTPTVTDAKGGRNATANRANPKPTTTTTSWTLSDVAYADRWGDYGPAIARWEHITGRPAPDATEPGKNGQPRLAAPFVEWLMGLPAGWVTDHLQRNAALKCLGNGVVWRQAAHAYADLLGVRAGAR